MNMRLTVTTLTLLATSMAATTLPGCASKKAARSEKAEADLVAAVAEPNAQLPRFRIRDWSAPNDQTIIVVADDGTRYRAQTLGPCIGLNFATTLAFVNRGGFEQVDRFSSVVLRDGTRCTFQSFDRLKSAEQAALDNYENAKEAPAESENEEAAKRDDDTASDETKPSDAGSPR